MYRLKKIIRSVVVICACVFISTNCFADNNPDAESRGSGYYPTEITEYPEFNPIYEDIVSFNIFESFNDRKVKLRAKDSGHIECDSDTLYVSYREYDLENSKVRLTHILTKDATSQIKAGLSNDTFGGEREYTSDFAKRTGAVVAINGSYFYYNTGQPIDICAPVVLNNGNVLRSGGTNGSEICLRFDGSFFSPHPMMSLSNDELVDYGVVSNFGTADPLLISDGAPMSFPAGVTDKVYPRSAIGVVSPGEYYIITAGENGGYSKGLSYKQMQCIFYHLGCTYARSFDGGGSVTLVINGELKNTPAEGKERAVVDFLAFYE